MTELGLKSGLVVLALEGPEFFDKLLVLSYITSASNPLALEFALLSALSNPGGGVGRMSVGAGRGRSRVILVREARV